MPAHPTRVVRLARLVTLPAGTPSPPGFYAIVSMPAPLTDAAGSVLDALRPVVATSRGGVLMGTETLGYPGQVLVTGRAPDGAPLAPARAFGPVTTATDTEVLADWLAIGGPPAPLPERLRALLRASSAEMSDPCCNPQ